VNGGSSSFRYIFYLKRRNKQTTKKNRIIINNKIEKQKKSGTRNCFLLGDGLITPRRPNDHMVGLVVRTYYTAGGFVFTTFDWTCAFLIFLSILFKRKKNDPSLYLTISPIYIFVFSILPFSEEK
jgi:hypothetical protein